jgi:osmoprotectant transport system ATP-binding protein
MIRAARASSGGKLAGVRKNSAYRAGGTGLQASTMRKSSALRQGASAAAGPAARFTDRTRAGLVRGAAAAKGERLAVITLKEVSKSYRGKAALDRTSLEIGARNCLALIGPSGCGKSTLLRLVVGLIQSDTGEISVGGTPVTPASARSVRLRLGYVIQDGGLFPHLTAAGNVTLTACELRWPPDRIRKRVAELAELTRLPVDLLDRYPAQLSGGQRQRVGLMRALMLDPEVLLMDEPLGALDPIIRSQLQSDLKQIFQRLEKTVLLVTHDMGEAAYLGDEIALMRDGRILQRGRLKDLLDQPADPFVTVFIRAQRPLWSEKVEAVA